MTNNRMNCFIAMRFGEKDTDTIYKHIDDVVCNLGLEPKRVDRIQHNERIDQKIISELNQADIVIADLTYARPCVYYEAGFAARQVPVIYTCRKDHFRNKEDTLRVHFDLDKENIIPWESENDSSFLLLLRNRLRYVLEMIARPPWLDDLKNFLLDARTSMSNPDNIYERIRYFHRDLEQNKICIPSASCEEIVLKRNQIFKKYFQSLELIKETERDFKNLWEQLFNVIRNEVDSIKAQFSKSSRYGLKFTFAHYLKTLYPLYLETCKRIYQRPSIEYQEVYNKIMQDTEDLISFFESQEKNLEALAE